MIGSPDQIIGRRKTDLAEARMKILVTNDDGFEAPGLRALFETAGIFGQPLVVAPADCHSIKGHAVTTNAAIRVVRHDHSRFGSCYTCDGTPADCVRIALKHLPFGSVDVVLAGINHGANAGVDVYYSGTVAAAREAAMLGKTGVAVSKLSRANTSDNWPQAAEFAEAALREVFEGSSSFVRPQLINVNLPDPLPEEQLRGIKHCALTPEALDTAFEPAPRESATSYDTRYTGRYFNRPAPLGYDFHYLLNNWITITPLLIDATDHSVL